MKKNGENEIKNNSTTKKSSLGSRLKTAIIVLPILFTMFLYPFFYLILMILVIYFSHKEFYIILRKMYILFEKTLYNIMNSIRW